MKYRILTAYSLANQPLARAIASKLADQGVVSEEDVMHVQNGLDAAVIAANQNIPLLIVDNKRLPGLTGPEVAKRLEETATHDYHVILTIGIPVDLDMLKHPERVTTVEKNSDLSARLVEVARRHLQVNTNAR